MSVLHPPIQEEVTIRKNIALGPAGLGQYFSVFTSPLGLGGTIRTLYTRSRQGDKTLYWPAALGQYYNIALGQY